MSENKQLSDTVQKFLSWQRDEVAPLSDGMSLVVNYFGLSSFTICVLREGLKETAFFQSAPSQSSQVETVREIAAEHNAHGDIKWASETKASNGLYFTSYLNPGQESGSFIHLCLWSDTKIALSEAEQTFVDMGMNIFSQKLRKINIEGIKLPKLLLEALDAVEDAFIIYDKDQKIIAFNEKQKELFPSVAGSLEVGSTYDAILRKQFKSRQLDIPEEEADDWIEKRKTQLDTHGFSEEQSFDNGQTIRLTNYRTKSGGAIAVRSDITELVEARKQAQENEEIFKSLLEGAPIPLIVVQKGICLYGNSFAHEILELDTSIEGREAADFYWDLADQDRHLAQSNAKKHVVGDTFDLRTEKGRRVTSLMSSTIIPYGGRNALFISLMDISELNKTKEALELSEKQMGEILELIPDALVVQTDGEIQFINQSAVSILAANSKADIIGKKSIELAAESERERVLNSRISSMERGEALAINTKHLRQTGEEFHTELYTQPIIWNDKKGTLSIFRDMTKRREYEEKIREKEKEMSLAQQIGRFGHWRLHIDEQEVTWSEELINLHAEENMAKDSSLDWAANIIVEEDQEILRNSIEEVIRTGKSRNFEARVLSHKGKLKYMVGTMQPEFDEQGRVISVFGVSQDATDRRELEDKLRQSQKMEAVGQLTGGIAHDFNNLLAVIHGNTELLMEMIDADDSSKRARLEAILNASERGAELTNSMLAFGRTQSLKPTKTCLNENLLNIHKVLERTIEENIHIEKKFQEDLWYCHVDAGQVENALLNLSLNARDAMPSGGTISISTENVQLNENDQLDNEDFVAGDYVKLSVSDTGTGISEDQLEHVFEPFFTTKEVGKGTGLGLSMVYGFVKQSKGHISINSELQKGTTVNMYLPRFYLS